MTRFIQASGIERFQLTSEERGDTTGIAITKWVEQGRHRMRSHRVTCRYLPSPRWWNPAWRWASCKGCSTMLLLYIHFTCMFYLHVHSNISILHFCTFCMIVYLQFKITPYRLFHVYVYLQLKLHTTHINTCVWLLNLMFSSSILIYSLFQVVWLIVYPHVQLKYINITLITSCVWLYLSLHVYGCLPQC